MVKTAPSGDLVLRLKEAGQELNSIDQRLMDLTNERRQVHAHIIQLAVDNHMYELFSLNRRALQDFINPRERRPRS